MEKTPLRHAWEELSRARAASDRMRTAKLAVEVESHWREFLVAANAVFTKLEKASREDPRAQPWFGGIKHTRSSDELLCYLLHARNSSEHGVTDIAERSLSLGMAGSPGARLYGVGANERGEIMEHPLNRGMQYTMTTGIQLVPVHDRGVVYPVPTRHLGDPLASATPRELCERAVVFLDRILREASRFAD